MLNVLHDTDNEKLRENTFSLSCDPHPLYPNAAQMSSPRGAGSSAGKESACNAGDPGSIPGSGRSAGEGIGYPLQSSWASLVAQLVKNLPAMQEDPLEKGKATHSSILAWRLQRVGHN